MTRGLAYFLFGAAIATGCGSVTSSDGSDAAVPADAARLCDPLAPFGAPMPLGRLASPDLIEDAPRLSSDELTLYFSGKAATGDYDLYAAHRRVRSDDFDAPSVLTQLSSSSGDDFDPFESPDGLTLWFSSGRIAGQGGHLYLATRMSRQAEFGPAALASVVGASDTSAEDAQPFVTADGEELWLTSTRAPTQGVLDVWRSVRSGGVFTAPIAEPSLSSASEDFFPTLSADRLTIYVSSNRPNPGATGNYHIFRSHRAVVSDAFPAPVRVDELNTTGNDFATWLSADNCRIYGSTDIAGSDDIFVATRPFAQ